MWTQSFGSRSSLVLGTCRRYSSVTHNIAGGQSIKPVILETQTFSRPVGASVWSSNSLGGTFSRNYATDGSVPSKSGSLKKKLLLVTACSIGGLYAYRKYTAQPTGPQATSDAKVPTDSLTALNPNDFVAFPLKGVMQVTHDSNIYRFALPTPEHKLGLPVASCIVTRTMGTDGKPIIRPYTPISTEDQKGYFDLLVKVYPQGVMSKHIDSLALGDKLEVKGPIPKLQYTPNMKKEIGMLAGGTGITPMYQVLQKILSNPEDKTKVKLVFCNKTPEDVLLKKVLDDLAKKHSNFEVYYMVDSVPSEDATHWKGGVGFINPDVVKKHIPAPSPDVLVFVCGPPGFYNVLSGPKTPDYQQGELKGILKDLGFNESQVFKF